MKQPGLMQRIHRTFAAIMVILSLGLLAVQISFAQRARSASAPIEALTAQEKLELQKKRKRFESLPRPEQERLRRLHRSIEEHPDSDRLRRVMERYVQWLLTLPAAERAKLADLPPQERLGRVAELKRYYDERKFRELVRNSLHPDDKRAISQWLDERLKDREADLRQESPERYETLMERFRDPASRRRFFLMTLVRRDRSPSPFLTWKPDEVDALVNELSTEATEVYRIATTDEQRQTVLKEWIRETVFSWTPRRPSEADLRRFEETLDAPTRARLEAMSYEEYKSELRELYFLHHWPMRRPPGRSFRGPPRHDRSPDAERPRDERPRD